MTYLRPIFPKLSFPLIGLISFTISTQPFSFASAATLTTTSTLILEQISNPQIVDTNWIDPSRFFSVALSENNDILGADLENTGNSSPSDSLSPQTILNSLSQLSFDLWANFEPEDVPIVPQTTAAKVYRGVYDFYIPNSTPSTESEIYTFNPVRLTVPFLAGRGDGRTSSTFSLASGQPPSVIDPVTPDGITLPRSGGIRASLVPDLSALSPLRPAVPTSTNTTRQQIEKLQKEEVDTRFTLYPRGEFSQIPRDFDPRLSEMIQDMEDIFDLKVDFSFRLLPQQVFLTPLDVKDDFVATSPLLNRSFARKRLQASEQFQSLVRQNAEEQEKEMTEYLEQLEQRSQQQYQKIFKNKKQNQR